MDKIIQRLKNTLKTQLNEKEHLEKFDSLYLRQK